jgi:predicted unusual protein kinase regulating ubiquinone biosynthesis (AarF/ABC1/UbiB family)
MFDNIKKNIKSFLFIINVFFIISNETLLYYFYKDYSSFIDRLTKKLSSINILYVKIFQAFALNNSLIDDKTNNKLLSFTDNAPWKFTDIDLPRLVEMSKKYNINLRYGYEIPINSGMISLVFKGYIQNQPIVIKMKRKNIQNNLNDAINNLLFLMYVLSFIPIVNKYQIAEVVNRNIDMIRHQTNFIEEIDNMERIRNNCKNLKYVKIPTAIRQITEDYPDIIVMDYIEGMRINKIKEEDYEQFAKLVVKFGTVTTLLHGVTHGDLHSGNILFIKDNKDIKTPYKIGVIDFGIIYEVENQYKGFLFDLFTQIFEISPRESAEKFLNSGIIDPPNILKQIPEKDYNNILSFTTEIINETIYSSKKANQLQIYKFLSKFKHYLSKEELCNIGIRPSDNFAKTQLVLAMSHGVTLTLCNNDYITLVDKVINELFHTDIILN